MASLSSGLRLLCCLLLLYVFSAGVQAAQGLDLASVKDRASLLHQLQLLEDSQGLLEPQQALQAQGWKPATTESLAAPRRRSTLWLHGTLFNGSDTPVTRWLEVAPWRLGNVQLMLLQPDAATVDSVKLGGLAQPVEQRELRMIRTVFAVTLAPGEQREVLLRLHSDSRPYVAVDVWEPDAFLHDDHDGHVLHAALLGCVLTLLLVMLVHLDARKLLLGVWGVLAFAVEAEKQGYISFQFFSALAEHGLALRLALVLLTHAAFLLASLLLLDIWRHRRWRAVQLTLLGAALMLAVVAPQLDANVARNLGAVLVGGTLLIWPFSLSVVRLRGEPGRFLLLALFFLNWAESAFMTMAYVVNVGYTALFATSSIIIKIGTILAIVGVFAMQTRRAERERQREALENERTRSAWLEETVNQRTEELRKALVAANEAGRAKTEFLARVSHDLRSPLTSIIGYARLMHLDPGRVAHNTSVILNSANHMLTLVNDLIDYASGASADRLQVAPLYIYALLEGVAHDASVLAKANRNNFTLTFESELPSVLCADGKRLRQVLINLVDNAAKFTRDGQIELRVGCRPCEEAPERVVLRLAVRDTGCGISAEEQAKLFEPFYRAGDGSSVGAGLGLPIVDEWVRRMDGRLEVDSTPGVGTCISVDLALEIGRESDLALPQVLDSHHVASNLAGAGRRLWVVEDIAEIRELLVQDLERAGFVVHAASDGQAFIDQLEASERPALVLTDHLMPRADGEAVMAAVRRHWPGVPVVLLSATQKTMQSAGLQGEPGFDDSLLKPVCLDELHASLARLLGDVPVEVVAPEPPSMAGAAALLDEIEPLLGMGALTDLLEWAERLEQEQPQHADLARHVRELVERGDFEGVRALWQPAD